MNPFDAPPHGDPLPLEPPDNGSAGRGRMVLVALLTAGLIGGGIVGVSAFASADRPGSVAATPDPPDEPTDDETNDPPPTTIADDRDDESPEPPESPDRPEGDGEIVIDLGDGEPTVIDLGEFDEGTFERLNECLGLPRYEDFDLGEFGEFGDFPFEDLDLDQLLEDLPFDPEDFDFGEFGDFEVLDGIDGTVTVMGPDGVSVVDLGENGSVTISKADGEITIDTTGDATVQELTDLFGDLPFDFDGDWNELDGELQEKIDELVEGLPNLDELDELPEFDLPPIGDIQDCVDQVLGN